MLRGEHLNIVAVLERADGSKEIHRATNIVTDAGDVYYAQRAAGEAPTNAFDALHLGTSAVAPTKADDADDLTAIAASGKAAGAGYPQTDDQDADNTGKAADAVTWKFTYATADGAFADVACGGIAVGAGALGAAEALLTRFLFAAPFSKTADDTLTVYVNHTANGV